MSGSDESGGSEMRKEAFALLERDYLQRAADPDTEARIDDDLRDKLDRLSGRGGARNGRVRALAEQARELWARRKLLERRHVITLGAALLYFISPVDALPDITPVLGYIDDIAVLSAVIASLLKVTDRAREKVEAVRVQVVEEATDKLVDKGRVALNEMVDARADELFGRFDAAASAAVDNSVTTLVVSLWGMTSAAAVSLALAVLYGGFSGAFASYVLIAAVLLLCWNFAVAVDYLRGYRALDGRWQQRLRTLVAARLGWRHALAIGLPVLLLCGLGVARLLI